jgi:hypothetical protein
MSPISQGRGWALGRVDDWDNGARGRIIWISLAVLMADSFVKIRCFLLRPLQTIYPWREMLHAFLNHMAQTFSNLARNPLANDLTRLGYTRAPSAAIDETDTYGGEDPNGIKFNTGHGATDQIDRCSPASLYSPLFTATDHVFRFLGHSMYLFSSLCVREHHTLVLSLNLL